MAILGAHMSIAGGYHKAVHEARRCRCDCVQLFTKNNNQWRAKPLSDDEADRFRSALDELDVQHPLSHSSYLINLATPEASLWKKSIDSLVVEMYRAERLGIAYVVLHPGAYTTGTEAGGLRRIVRALNEVQRQTRGIRTGCMLETTAGQGSVLGWRFEHLASILDAVKDSHRLAVCFDTCHVFAAGYPLGTPKQYRATMREFNKVVGIERIRAFHLNDSQRELGSRIDRHAHIGRGRMGLEPFRNLLNDRRFRKVPMYLETPKGERNGKPWDVVNLKKLRSLIDADRSR